MSSSSSSCIRKHNVFHQYKSNMPMQCKLGGKGAQYALLFLENGRYLTSRMPAIEGTTKSLILLRGNSSYGKHSNRNDRSFLSMNVGGSNCTKFCSPSTNATTTIESWIDGREQGYEPRSTLLFSSNLDTWEDNNFASLDEKERLRRKKISNENKGNIPWNKGRKHTAETIQRIRERTKIAMQDPEVRLKLKNLGHPQSKETKMKIGIRVRQGWQRRHKRMSFQETCILEWKNLIAEECRRGFSGEEELQWNSFDILTEQAKLEWLESIAKRKILPRPKGNKRAPKSQEQREKISEAIRVKWADPDYCARVCNAMAKYHGTSVSLSKKQQKQIVTTGPARMMSNDKQKLVSNLKTSRRKTSCGTSNYSPLCKDPLANSKLQMIKKIKESRDANRVRKLKGIQMAKLLIEQAERTAEVLELAALESSIALSSLIETRDLIAQAKWYISSAVFAEGAGHLSTFNHHKNNAKATCLESQMTQKVNASLINDSKLQNSEEYLPIQNKVDGSLISSRSKPKKMWVRGKLLVILDD